MLPRTILKIIARSHAKIAIKNKLNGHHFFQFVRFALNGERDPRENGRSVLNEPIFFTGFSASDSKGRLRFAQEVFEDANRSFQSAWSDLHKCA